jgi:hypothetical protein
VSYRIQWTPDTKPMEQMLQQAPAIYYKNLRELMFLALHGHRQHWLSLQGNRFGRGGRGVKVSKVGQTIKVTNRSVHYVLPKRRTYTTDRSALRGLEQLDKSEIRSDSTVLRHLDAGGSIKARKRRWMTIPVKARPASLKEWRKKYPSRKLARVKQPGGNVAIYEIKGKRKKKAILRWYQARRVTNKPTLKFYDAWDALASRRSDQFRKFSNQMVQDLKDRASGKSA